ncbi:MAG: LLM class flavin-dependent oxidoreductase [Dehalococcoidia bacterium]|nr:LLM class flavin-dependent oxidoreductase [Dehalococcoidia bacterium]
MKFALFILASWTEKDTSAQGRIYTEALEQIEYAEELGFDSVWIAEHHSSRYGICPSLMPMVTYVAARTKRIRIGTGVSVLPFHNPILLAEESAMMDVLSDGRLEFGVGRGSADYEFGNFKIDFDSRDARFQEALDIILGLWTTPRFTYHGQFYQVDGLTLAPTPLQRPHPPVFLAVSRTPASVDVAVSRDLPILTSFSTPDTDNMGLFSLYAERCSAAGKPAHLDRMPYFRFVYLSEDEGEAREYPREALTWVRDLGGLRRTITSGDEIDVDLDHWRRTRPVDPPSYESELETTAYFGTPDQCTRWIDKLRTRHDIGYFGASMSFGAMEHARVMRSMELFATQVMPNFR